MSLRIKCPVCNKEDTVRLFTKQGRTFVKCREDGLVYINPQPKKEELQEIYDAYGRKLLLLPEPVGGTWDYPDYRIRFLDFRMTNRLLEIGTAAGGFLVRCREDGWNTYGVELSSPSSRFARDQQGLDVVTGTLHDAQYPSDFFDVVVAWQTLEHVPNPREIVEEVRRILRPGGFSVFSVPCWSGLSIRLLGKRYRYVGRDHLFYFSSENLARMLGNADFSNVCTRTAGFNPIACFQDAGGSARRLSGFSGQKDRPSEPLPRRWERNFLLGIIHRLYSKVIEGVKLGDTLFAEGVKAISGAPGPKERETR